MKTLTKLNILLLVCCLATSNIKAQKQAVNVQYKTATLKSEELKTIRFALNNYLTFDNGKTNKAKETSPAIAENMNPSKLDAEENTKISFDKNLQGVEQIVNQCNELLDKNKYLNLMIVLYVHSN